MPLRIFNCSRIKHQLPPHATFRACHCRFTENETFTEAFTLHVRLLDSDCNIIQVGATALEVHEFYGVSNLVDRNVLSFDFDQSSNLDCMVRVATQETFLPAHGRLVMGKLSMDQARGDNPHKSSKLPFAVMFWFAFKLK